MNQHQPDLAGRLSRGEYVVDAKAVAAAIIHRSTTEWFLGSRLAEMFESGEPDRLPRSVEKQRARSVADLA